MVLDQANCFIYDDYNDSLDFSHSYSHDGFETLPQAQSLSLLGND